MDCKQQSHQSNPIPSHHLSRKLLIIGISQILHENNISIDIPGYPMQTITNSNPIQPHLTKEQYLKLTPFIRCHHILHIHQISRARYPQKFINIILPLQNITPQRITTHSSTNIVKFKKAVETINIHTDGSIKHHFNLNIKAGAGIFISSQTIKASYQLPSAQDATQAELQAITIAILISPKD
jgi:hypothetical protein